MSLLPRHIDLRSGPILDIGANAGDWTAAVMRLVPAATVVAFEPDPNMAKRLRERFSGSPGVRVLQEAVSDRDGEATFHVTAHSHNSSLRVPRDMNLEYAVESGWEQVQEITVHTSRLDDLVRDSPDPSLVKIDVQGAEQLVLWGGQDTLRRSRTVLIEVSERSHYEGDSSAVDLDRSMRELGYERGRRSDPWCDAVTRAVLWYDVCYVNRNIMR